MTTTPTRRPRPASAISRLPVRGASITRVLTLLGVLLVLLVLAGAAGYLLGLTTN